MDNVTENLDSLSGFLDELKKAYPGFQAHYPIFEREKIQKNTNKKNNLLRLKYLNIFFPYYISGKEAWILRITRYLKMTAFVRRLVLSLPRSLGTLSGNLDRVPNGLDNVSRFWNCHYWQNKTFLLVIMVTSWEDF